MSSRHPRPRRALAPEFTAVGYVTDDEQLVVLRLTRDCVPVARARGWMVWDDFERAVRASSPQADGDDGGGAVS